MSREAVGVDRCDMIWPVAALAVLVLGFVVVYGSLVQSRLEIGRDRNDSRQARRDIAG
jgi:lipopolysaccharide export LptBFGC system permease protein LptF